MLLRELQQGKADTSVDATHLALDPKIRLDLLHINVQIAEAQLAAVATGARAEEIRQRREEIEAIRGEINAVRTRMLLSTHVSMTSVSGINSLLPHSQVSWIVVTLGSTGSSSGLASLIFPQSLQYHAGTGVANTRCLLSTQSQSSPVAQSMSRCLIQSGYQVIALAVSTTFSVRLMVLRNH